MQIIDKIIHKRRWLIEFCTRLSFLLSVLCLFGMVDLYAQMAIQPGHYRSKVTPPHDVIPMGSIKFNWGQYVLSEVLGRRREGLQAATFNKKNQNYVDRNGEVMESGIRARRVDMHAPSEVQLKVYTVHDPRGNNPSMGALIYWAVYEPDSSEPNDDFEGTPGNPEYETETGVFWPTLESSMDMKALFTSLDHFGADENLDVLMENWSYLQTADESWGWDHFIDQIIDNAGGQDSRVYAAWQPIIVELIAENAIVSEIAIPGVSAHRPDYFFPEEVESLVPEKLVDYGLAGSYARLVDSRKYPDYIAVSAHRGYWEEPMVPEHSKKAFDLAIEFGTDVLEFDVRMTQDGVVVAFHDPCMNRLTDFVSTHIDINEEDSQIANLTWDQIKTANLKDRFGIPVIGEHIMTIEEALNYVKGRVMIGFDIKAAGDVYKEILKKSLTIAKENGTLNQLIIKGKLTSSELLQLTDEVGVSTNDFIYTPVVFGWDTPDLQGVFNDLKPIADLKAWELVYKVNYDPLLEEMPWFINNGKRVGQYSFWPESIEGASFMITETCEILDFPYNFLNQHAAKGAEGDPGGLLLLETNDNNSYAPSGSFGYVETANDGRSDWDWLISKGANYIISDRSKMIVEYLETAGKRNPNPAVITEPKLPRCVTLEGEEFCDMRIMARKVSDYTKVEFFTPDTRNVDINGLILNPETANGWTPEIFEERKALGLSCTCADVYQGHVNEARLINPLHTLADWSRIYPGYDIYINSNFFNVNGANFNYGVDDRILDKPIASMYSEPCTEVIGYWQSPEYLEGPLSTVDDDDLDHQNLDAFVVTNDGRIHLVYNQDTKNWYDKAIVAVAGYIGTDENGNPLATEDMPEGSARFDAKKKSGVGIKGNELYFINFGERMLPGQAAEYFSKVFGCEKVFLFDGGGSASLLSSRGYAPCGKGDSTPVGPTVNACNKINDGLVAKLGGDEATDGEKKLYEDAYNFAPIAYRPTPNFLAIKVKNQ